MPGTPTSPTSRRKRRTSSAGSLESYTADNGASRRGSQHSIVSLRSSRVYGTRDGFIHNRSSSSIGDLAPPMSPTGAGLQESLADELAAAWGEADGVEDGDEASQNGLSRSGSRQEDSNSPVSPVKINTGKPRDSGIDVVSSPAIKAPNQAYASHRRKNSSKSSPNKAHSRKQSQIDSKPPKNEEAQDTLSSSLKASLADIDMLARQGLNQEETIDEVGDPIASFLHSVKNLGGQQAILETGATRLITAHTSISMHLANQSRMLQSLAYYVLYPTTTPSVSDGEETDLLPIVASVLDTVPRPTTEALSGLHRFHASTQDLRSSLTSISDNLHMSRQVTSAANQRLKSAKEIVAELRKEYQAAETGISWLEKGDWDRKLERRECANVCRDVVSGFEQVCDVWRSKLAAQGVSS